MSLIQWLGHSGQAIEQDVRVPSKYSRCIPQSLTAKKCRASCHTKWKGQYQFIRACVSHMTLSAAVIECLARNVGRVKIYWKKERAETSKFHLISFAFRWRAEKAVTKGDWMEETDLSFSMMTFDRARIFVVVHFLHGISFLVRPQH